MANELFNNQAEQHLLAAILKHPEKYFEINTVGLAADDFANRDHKFIFQAIETAVEEKSDPTVPFVTEYLKIEGQNKTVDYVTDLAFTPASVAEAIEYARVIKGLSISRNLGYAGVKIIEISQEKRADYYSALVEAENAIKVVADALPVQERSPGIDEILARMAIAEDDEKIPILFSPTLQSLTGGFAPGHFWVIGGFSSTGKSAFAANLALDILQKPETSVAIISAEMTQEQYVTRLLAIDSGVPQQDIASKVVIGLDKQKNLVEARRHLMDVPLYVYDNLYRMPQIRTELQRLKNQKGLDVVILDYIQNVSVTGDEVRDAREVAIECQRLAKDLQCTVIAFSQVSNQMAQMDAEGGNDDFYSFKGHGAIRDAADVAIMLKRNRSAQSSALKVDIKKNRHGPISRFVCNFDLPTGRIDEMEWEDDEDET